MNHNHFFKHIRIATTTRADSPSSKVKQLSVGHSLTRWVEPQRSPAAMINEYLVQGWTVYESLGLVVMVILATLIWFFGAVTTKMDIYTSIRSNRGLKKRYIRSCAGGRSFHLTEMELGNIWSL
jgi:hypothetical protein